MSQPNTSGAASTELPSYVKEKREIDTNALREERLAEVRVVTGLVFFFFFFFLFDPSFYCFL